MINARDWEKKVRDRLTSTVRSRFRDEPKIWGLVCSLTGGGGRGDGGRRDRRGRGGRRGRAKSPARAIKHSIFICF